MTDITIPTASRKAAALAIIYLELDHEKRHVMPPTAEEAADAACLAMLRSWPGMYDEFDGTIILPLQEKPGHE